MTATGATALVGITAGCLGGEQGQSTETGDGGTATGTSNATNTGAPTTTDASGSIQGTVANTPAGLEVTSRELYGTNGDVGLRGTIENTSEQSFGFVEANVTLQDDQGDVLYEFIDETEEETISELGVGETWQFDVRFQEANMADVRTYTIDVDGYQLPGNVGPNDIVGEIDDQDPNLEIVSHDLSREASTTYVTGAVRNVGKETIDTVEASVTLYDDNNNELLDLTDTVEEESDTRRLVPGETWNFQVKFTDIDMKSIARYVVSADSDII